MAGNPLTAQETSQLSQQATRCIEGRHEFAPPFDQEVFQPGKLRLYLGVAITEFRHASLSQ